MICGFLEGWRDVGKLLHDGRGGGERLNAENRRLADTSFD